MPAGHSRRLALQIAAMRRVTATLKRLGLRRPIIRCRTTLARARRRVFERAGSSRYSLPALHGIDTRLDRLLDCDDGFFIEAGGYDGYTQSNTYYLERFRGWQGILVEPMCELAEEAARNRPAARVISCALVPDGNDVASVEMEFGELMSSVKGTHDHGWTAAGLVLGWRDPQVARVPARTLSSIIDEAGNPPVDLLSLDVEGFEVEVLRGLDLSRHAPTWILVEMHDVGKGRREVGDLLGARYAEHGLLSPLDMLYRRVDAPRGAPA